MTRPEDALAAARRAAAEARARGGYVEPEIEAGRADLPLEDKLVAWSLPDPDVREVRSTRRAGRPVTVLKQLLLRLLGQYHALLIAEQTRFNVNHLLLTRRLEQRVAALEAEVADLRRRLAERGPSS